MFLVGDQPLLQSRAIDQLIAAFESGGRICYPSCGGRRGNPVIFDARFFPELQRLSGDSGGRTVIEAYPDAVVPVIFTDESLFRDVDRRAALAMLAAVHGRSHKQTSLARALGLDASRVISLCGAGGKTSLMAALTRELASDGERVLATTTTKMATSELDGPWRACRADDCDDLLARTNDLAAPLLAYRTLARERSRLRGFSVAVIDELAASGRFTRIIVEADGSRRRPLKAPNAREPVLPSATDAVVMVAGVGGLGWPLDDNAVFRPDRWCALTQLRMGETVTPESLARVVVHPDGLARGTQARRILFLNQADTPDRLAAARRVIDSLPAHGGHVPERALIGRLQPEPEICELREFGSRTPAHAEGRNERWGRSTPGD
jgi:probable selenium-dependent hydroxylase accessory protein YqeC